MGEPTAWRHHHGARGELRTGDSVLQGLSDHICWEVIGRKLARLDPASTSAARLCQDWRGSTEWPGPLWAPGKVCSLVFKKLLTLEGTSPRVCRSVKQLGAGESQNKFQLKTLSSSNLLRFRNEDGLECRDPGTQCPPCWQLFLFISAIFRQSQPLENIFGEGK